jgi:hypothetical protein
VLSLKVIKKKTPRPRHDYIYNLLPSGFFELSYRGLEKILKDNDVLRRTKGIKSLKTPCGNEPLGLHTI